MPPADLTDVTDESKINWLGVFAVAWAVVGFVVLIGRALLGMSTRIHDTLSTPLSGLQLAMFGGSTIIFGVAKGYYVFHERFCPRYAARIRALCQTPNNLPHTVLAPLFCLSLLGTDRRNLIRGYLLIAAIAAMVFSTRLMPNPWRGMILTGVAVALSWAAIEIIYRGARELVLLISRQSRPL